MTLDRYRNWFVGLSARERVLVTGLGALVLLMLLWFALVMPLTDFRSAARAAHATALEDRAEADALLTRLGGSGAGAIAAEDVAAVFAEAGLQPRVEPADGGLSVRLEAVRADVLFNLLGRIEGEGGMIIAGADITANDDATLSARLQLIGGGA